MNSAKLIRTLAVGGLGFEDTLEEIWWIRRNMVDKKDLKDKEELEGQQGKERRKWTRWNKMGKKEEVDRNNTDQRNIK